MTALSLVSVLAEPARRRPDHVALVEGHTRVTYAELWHDARGVAAALADRGVRPGDRVALHQLLARVVPDVVPEGVPAPVPGDARDDVPDGAPAGTPGGAPEDPGTRPQTDPRPTDQERTP